MADVPRETSQVEPEPEVAADIFGAQIDRARRFAEALTREGELRGLIGPLELPRLWSRHILNCAVLAPLMTGRVADVGSGAGLPGLVLAIARPDVHFTLIEPMERRTDWLGEQADRLALANVRVVRARADELGTERFDMVTARAVGALPKLIPMTAPLVEPGGELILMKGESVAAEIAKAGKAFDRFSISEVRVELLGQGLPIDPTRVFRAKVG